MSGFRSAAIYRNTSTGVDLFVNYDSTGTKIFFNKEGAPQTTPADWPANWTLHLNVTNTLLSDIRTRLDNSNTNSSAISANIDSLVVTQNNAYLADTAYNKTWLHTYDGVFQIIVPSTPVLKFTEFTMDVIAGDVSILTDNPFGGTSTQPISASQGFSFVSHSPMSWFGGLSANSTNPATRALVTAKYIN